MNLVWFFLAISIANYFIFKVLANHHFNPQAKRRFNILVNLALLLNGIVSVVSIYSGLMVFLYTGNENHALLSMLALAGIGFGLETFVMWYGWNKRKNADAYFDITNEVYISNNALLSRVSEAKKLPWSPKER